MNNIYFDTYIKNIRTMVSNINNNKERNLVCPNIGPTCYGC